LARSTSGKELHREFRGQRYGGISTPPDQPFVLCFTGETGKKHGYRDWWDTEAGVLHYYGEGQSGDMEFTHGNKAIRDHATDGEDLYVFEVVKPAFVSSSDPRTARAMRSGRTRRGWHCPQGHHLRTGDARQRRIEEDSDSRQELAGLDLDELRRRALETPAQTPDAREAKRRAYRRSKALKMYVRARAGGRCEECEERAPFKDRRGQPYIEPHHTRRISDGGPDHPRWVIALCPECHARVHFGLDGETYNEDLKAKLGRLEPADLTRSAASSR
jgi:5-methylcytosine-specific restriction enzyme A